MSRRKPRATMTREFLGLWGFGPIMEWVARDENDNIISHDKVRRVCEKDCVRKGYVLGAAGRSAKVKECC